MSSSLSLRALAPALLLLAAPLASARAQARDVVLTGFTALDHALPPGTQHLVGASLASYTGPVGWRLSGAFGGPLDSALTSGRGPSAWAADVDFLISPTRTPGWHEAFGGLDVAGYMGIGANGTNEDGGVRQSVATLSYGGILSHPITSSISFETEARRRFPMADEARIPWGFAKAWEYRFGLGIHFGGRSTRRRW